jgi:phosphosulfolactate phosphohydrolase-like enzyme
MNTRTVARLAQDYQFVVVDHVGLMANGAGKKAIEDWRVAAEISNVLKEITLAQHVGVLAAAQINREGETRGWIPPKLRYMAGADDLGRDCDVGIAFARMAESSVHYYAEKVRDQRPARWYGKFEPAVGDFDELSKDEALKRARADEEREADA